MITTNNPNPIMEEKGNRRVLYFPTSNVKCAEKDYFDKLCKPIQSEKQGSYNKKFMGVLLHYFRTQIDITEFDPENLINTINKDTDVEYNEQLDRQYRCLNLVDRYVVDHYKWFIHGFPIREIRVSGYSMNGVQKALAPLCENPIRMTEKQLRTVFESHPDIYEEDLIRFYRSVVYKLKQPQEIPDLFNIIKYMEYNRNKLVEQEKKECQEDGIRVCGKYNTANEIDENKVVTERELIYDKLNKVMEV